MSHPLVERGDGPAYGSVRIVVGIPADNGCDPITDYILQDAAGSVLSSSFTIGKGIVTITVSGLEGGRMYDVVLYAQNEQGAELQRLATVSFQTNERLLSKVFLAYGMFGIDVCL